MFNVINNQKSKNKILFISHFGTNEKRVIPLNSGNFRKESGKTKLSYCIDRSGNRYTIFRDYSVSGFYI